MVVVVLVWFSFFVSLFGDLEAVCAVYGVAHVVGVGVLVWLILVLLYVLVLMFLGSLSDVPTPHPSKCRFAFLCSPPLPSPPSCLLCVLLVVLVLYPFDVCN